MLRMPFGLCNSQSSQQRLMDNVLDGTKDCGAYIDNIIAYGKGSFIEHLEQIREVFDKLCKANLSLRVDKCIFASRKVTNLEFDFSTEGIKPSEKNIVKIKDFPTPKNVKELKRFLGLSNYYRQFMNLFATVAEPLQQLLRKNKEFIWGQSQEKAFNEIKKGLMSYSVIGFPNWNKKFLIEMDGSKVAAGATLLQEGDDGQLHPLSYFSSASDDAQKNYLPTKLECWAAIAACRKSDVYIRGAPKLILISDRNPLC